MRHSKASSESVHTFVPEALRAEALSSNDGILISELLRKLDASDAPVDFKVSTITEVANAHPEMTHIVNGCISTLARLSPLAARHLCRTLVNAPFNPDRDLIIAHAAATLASITELDSIDAQLIAKAVDHRSEVVQTSARRSVRLLPRAGAESLLRLTETLPSKPPHELLKRLLRSLPVTAGVGEAIQEQKGPERDISTPQTTVWQGPAGGALSPLVFSTPVMEALRDAEKKLPSPKIERAKRAHRKPSAHTTIPTATTSEQPAPSGTPDTAPVRPETAQAPEQPSAPAERPLQRLLQHRIQGFHLLSNTALSNTIIISKDYREVAAALAEITLRNGVDYALQFNNRLLYSLSDPNNPERRRFDDIANAWFQTEADGASAAKPSQE